MTEPIARAEQLALSYNGRDVALHDVNFLIEPGDALALIGPNGSGKSTLLKGMLGLVPVSAGRLEVLGKPPRQAAADVGYLPQQDQLDPEFPVSLRQVVLMGRFRKLGTWRWPGRADRAAVDAALARVGLAERARVRFGDLSGGQQQRGLLARALVSEPSLLLLDEPFNGLDSTNRAALIATLRELRAEGIGIVVSTHDLELATEVCSHALLVNGAQIAFGPVAEVLRPETTRLAFGDDGTHDAHPHPKADS